MTRDWGEDPAVINWMLWTLSKHYNGAAQEAFRAFVVAAGGIIPAQEPVDITIDFKPKDRNFLSLIEKIDPAKPTENFVSAEENIASFEQGTKFSNLDEFIDALERKLQETDEETIGNAEFGKTPWIWVIIDDNKYFLNSDTKRKGVKEFLNNHKKNKSLKSTMNRRRNINRITNDEYERKISCFHFYAEIAREKPGIIFGNVA